jgi:hypothetical protein
MRVGGQRHVPPALPPIKTPARATYPLVLILQGGMWALGPLWMGAENLDDTGVGTPNRSARSKSLYRLRYPTPSQYSQILGINEQHVIIYFI